MLLGILNEDDSRVAIVPEVIGDLKKIGIQIQVVSKSGEESGYSDALYKKQKVTITTKKKILESSDILVSINPLPIKDHRQAQKNAVFISRYAPFDPTVKIDQYFQKNHCLFSLDMVPRTTLAQSCDVLSSLASIAGYKSVISAAEYLPRYFPMLTTSAGTVPPAKVLVIGAGVAGLQAVATARRLGAIVEIFDTRSSVKEQAKSLGAKFVEVEGATENKSAGGYAVEQSKDYKKQQQLAISNSIQKSNVVITTAQLRGKVAPKLITKQMVESMAYGSVIVDLASSTGGNCILTKDDKIINHKGVTIIGDSDLSKKIPNHASLLFSKNIVNFLRFMSNTKDKFNLSFENEIIAESCIIRYGKKVGKKI